MAKALMVQGTSSHAGKSIIVAALCRIFSNKGVRVAPFKAQNMSLNSFVTVSGEEVARSQAFQSFAARVPLTSNMNPILLKPKGDMTSQIVFHGKPFRDISAKDYWRDFASTIGFEGVKDSFQKLSREYDIVVIEGAGSPAEVNLYDFDIANMKIAELADAPVLLVSDIDRGGAFASIIGTMNLLKPEHRVKVRGFILNKFRGDVKLLEPGLETVKNMTGTPVIGVLPYIHGLSLPDEDSVSLEDTKAETTRPIKIAVIRFPRISNFTDFESLQTHPMVNLVFAASKDDLLNADMVILPGTKNTIKDLEWLRNLGMSSVIQDLASNGIPIVGICGGYQMLGKTILDEKGIESGSTKTVNGLRLLDIHTSFETYDKVTELVSARVLGSGPFVEKSQNQELSGYEIHMGKTVLGPNARPLLRVFRGQESTSSFFDGAIDEKGLIFGSYLHGIFDKPPLRESVIAYLAARKGITARPRTTLVEEEWESSLERIVEAVERSLDMTLIFDLVGMKIRQ